MFIYKITKLKIKNFSKSKAFTLIELLIVIGITAIIAAIGIGYYGGSFKTKILDTTVQEITTYLRYAQRKSMSQEQGLQWGVHFENPASGQDFYALYNGSTYSNPIETKYLPEEIEFLVPENSSSTDIVFQKLTGFLSGSTYQQVILKEISTNQTKNVLACYQGLISFNTDISACGEVGGIDTTPPIIGEITVSNKAYGNYVSSPFDLSAEITDNEGGIKSCEYTTNGSNWYHAYLSGTGPSYACAKTITASDASTLTLNMRATSAGGIGVGSSITKTVDSSPPSDGTLTATPGTRQIQLSWSDFFDNGSGLATENTYKLVYLNSKYPAVNCTNGTQIYLGADTSYTHTGTGAGSAYYYRVCAYDALGNISNGATANIVPTEVGLAAYWKLDEVEGTTAYDNSGNGNNGTLINGPTWQSSSDCISGSCLSFDGSNDYVNCGHDESLTGITNNFTMELWVNTQTTHQIDSESTSGTGGVSGQKYAISPAQGNVWGTGHVGAGISVGTNGISVYEHGPDYMPALLVYQGSITGWNHIVVVYVNKQPKLYLNGTLVRTGLTSPKTYVHPGLQDSYGIGGMNYGYFNGLIDEVRIYNRALLSSEIQQHYISQAPGPVAYWKLDEGEGTTAYDNSGNGNDGTLINGPTWQSSSNCISGSCLSFDGSDDYVNCGNDQSLDITNTITIEAWVKWKGQPLSDHPALVSKGGINISNYYVGTWLKTREVYFTHYNGKWDDVRSGLYIKDNDWSFVAVTVNGNSVKFFVDGNEATKTQTTALLANTQTLKIGWSGNQAGQSFNGLIDEVRIYNRALSSFEIQQHYISQAPGPVAYWKLDEGEGTTAYDNSGNGNDGTLINGPTWQSSSNCISGSCLSFDGSDDYVNCGNDQSLDITNTITIEAWMKWKGQPLNDFPALVGKGGINISNYYVGTWLKTREVYFTHYNGKWDDVRSGLYIKDNDWSFVAVTVNGNSVKFFVDGNEATKTQTTALLVNTQILQIGQSFNGLIDEVRIYNRALLSSEIQQHYLSQAPGPVAYWKLDEGEGTTAYDNSGNGNDGTLINGPTWQSSSNCISGSCLSFDTSAWKYIEVPDSSSTDIRTNLTLEAWIYPRGPGGSEIYSTIIMSGGNGYFLFFNDSSNALSCYWYGKSSAGYHTTGSNTITRNTWNHVVCAWDATTLKQYINGTLVKTTNVTGEGTGSTFIRIGANTTNWQFDGLIDEVRIYNRALLSSEIEQHYISR